MLQLDNFYKARFVLSKVIRKTELVHTPRINPESDVYLKPECLQKTGSFKIRGAYYKISQLTDEEKTKGVIACSAGNHAQGVALGATAMGVKSLICLPEGAPISKVEATKRLGAEVCLVPGVYDDAYQKALELKDEHGYTFVHPFDDENVIAGQGTIGLEILDQLPDVEAVVVPVGGGGLISGVAFAIKSLNPNVKVYGVQAEGAASMVQSLHDHKQEKLPSVATVADGIAVKEPGKITFETCSNYVDEIVTVSEDEICAAILKLIESEKMVAEGAGAAGGMCGGLYSVYGGNIESGFEIVARLCDLDNKIKNADVVITGEGKTDSQTLMGKAPFRIAEACKKYGKKCVVVSGCFDGVTLGDEMLSLIDDGVTADEAVNNSREVLYKKVQKSLAIILK